MKHFWQFLIIVISWKYVGRRPIRFVTAPRVGAFHSSAIFAVLHWSFVFKHRTLLCCCLILVTISVGRKSKHRSFWWRSLHNVNTSRWCVLDDQRRQYTNYSCTRIPVHGPPTRVRVSGSLLALLTYEYPGGYGLSIDANILRLTGAYFKLTCNLLCKILRPPVMPYTASYGKLQSRTRNCKTCNHTEGYQIQVTEHIIHHWNIENQDCNIFSMITTSLTPIHCDLKLSMKVKITKVGWLVA